MGGGERRREIKTKAELFQEYIAAYTELLCAHVNWNKATWPKLAASRNLRAAKKRKKQAYLAWEEAR